MPKADTDSLPLSSATMARIVTTPVNLRILVGFGGMLTRKRMAFCPLHALNHKGTLPAQW